MIALTAAGAVVLVAGAVGAGIVLTHQDGGDITAADPAAGIYASAPNWAWSYKLADSNPTLLFTTDNHALVSTKITDGTTSEHIIAIDLVFGHTSWDRQLPDAAQCYAGTGRYKPDSTVVVCSDILSGRLIVLDAEDGTTLGTPYVGQSNVDVVVAGDTIYSCIEDQGVLTLQSGKATDLAENFSVSIAAGERGHCDIAVEDSYLVVSGAGNNMTTIVDAEGAITYESSDSSAQFFGEGLLTSYTYDDERRELPTYTTIIDVNGDKKYNRQLAGATVFTLPGRRTADIYIEKGGTVRHRVTGDDLWKYSNPNDMSVVGAVGDVLVMFEDATRLRGYAIDTGQVLWSVPVTALYKGGKPPAGVNLKNEFSYMGLVWRFAGDGETLVVSTVNLLTGIDVQTGEIIWENDTSGFVFAQQSNYLLLRNGERIDAVKFE
jgi:outer membrane protein assembly factor BamB